MSSANDRFQPERGIWRPMTELLGLPLVVEVERAEELLAGVAEPHAGGEVGLAEGAIGVGAGAVGGGDHAALVVGVQPGLAGGAGALVPDQGFVDSRAVHVAAEEIARAVIQQVGDHAGQGGLAQAPRGVVGQGGGKPGLGGAGQAVVEVVAVGPGASCRS
jgi:hypothetical protein